MLLEIKHSVLIAQTIIQRTTLLNMGYTTFHTVLFIRNSLQIRDRITIINDRYNIYCQCHFIVFLLSIDL